EPTLCKQTPRLPAECSFSPVGHENRRHMHLSVPKLDGLPSCVFINGVCQRCSDERATAVVLTIAETADGIFRVGLCFLIVGLDIQESSRARRACFLPSADHLKPAGKPITRHFARQLA